MHINEKYITIRFKEYFVLQFKRWILIVHFKNVNKIHLNSYVFIYIVYVYIVYNVEIWQLNRVMESMQTSKQSYHMRCVLLMLICKCICP